MNLINITGDKFVVMGGTGNHEADRHVLQWINNVAKLNLKFCHINFGEFPDGEPDTRIENFESIGGKIAIIFQSVYNDKLKEQLLDFAYACKYQYGAVIVIVVMSFPRYRRQDHGERIFEINRNHKFIHELKADGVDKLILCDIHSQETLDNCAKEGIAAYNVPCAQVFADRLAPVIEMIEKEGQSFYVYSPDAGSIPRAINLAKILGRPIMADLKNRSHDLDVNLVKDADRLAEFSKKYQHEIIAADKELINGSVLCIIEDELSTGGTAALAGSYLKKEMGAAKLIFCATHPVCCPGWKRKLIDGKVFDMILFGSTIPRTYEKETDGQITNVYVTKLVAQQLLVVMAETEKELEQKNQLTNELRK